MTTKAPHEERLRVTDGPSGDVDYVPYLIPMIGTPPYVFEGMTNFSLFLEADPTLSTAEHGLVDKYLNEPLGCTGENCIYRVASTNPFLVLSDVKSSSSAVGHGGISISYQEISLIIPVVVNDLKVAGYFLPILFVDGPPGGDQLQGAVPIVIGREMYGLPKVPAKIEIEYQGRQLSSASVTYAGKKIITVTGKSDYGPGHPKDYTGPQRLAFAEKVFGPIKPNQNYTTGTTQDGHVIDLRHIGHGNPLIGLRQMRNSGHLNLSGHQDVVESPYVLDSDVLPSPLGNSLTVEFDLSSDFFSALHLQPKYELKYPTDGAVYLNATATFGDPKQTLVRHIAPGT